MRLFARPAPSKEARTIIMRVFCDPVNQSGPSEKGLSTHDLFRLAGQRHARDSEQFILWQKQKAQRRMERGNEMTSLKSQAEADKSTSESTSVFGSLISQLAGKKPEEQITEEKTEDSQTVPETSNPKRDSNILRISAVPEENPVVSISFLKNVLLQYFVVRSLIQKVNYLEKIEHTGKSKQGRGKSKNTSNKPSTTVVEQRVWRWRLTKDGEAKCRMIAAL